MLLAMNIEEEIFSSYQVNKDKLLSYGFNLFKDVYTYQKDINNDFKALIVVDENNVLKGKVIEKAFDEEFIQLRNEAYQGGFIGEIREAYKDFLIDIRNNCFTKLVFISKQANRLMKLIKERYNEVPDHPFKDPHIKNYGVYRYKGNDKWYGLVMNINKSNLDKVSKDIYIDVINVRIDENNRENILKNKSIYPSYHMNKQKWVSIVLDDSLKDEEVMDYIDYSRNFMIGKNERKDNEKHYYIQPCNPKYYDLEAAFKRDNGVTGWKQSRKVNIGDICYMYIASPIGAIKYKCVVVETDIPYEYKSKEVSMTKLMKIKLLKTVNHNELTFRKLKELGISLIRGPVSISEEIASKIDTLL